ncbi:hypothetical protein P692DRAFT_20208850 [Suillus brevipes Sb2]|nr:hypothetical protein P692DRAFT_20208850 [Suillus brevipes Sb2]
MNTGLVSPWYREELQLQTDWTLERRRVSSHICTLHAELRFLLCVHRDPQACPHPKPSRGHLRLNAFNLLSTSSFGAPSVLPCNTSRRQQPEYTCPGYRQEITKKPVVNFVVRDMVSLVGSALGQPDTRRESSGQRAGPFDAPNNQPYTSYFYVYSMIYTCIP